jgi:hypothetical protein
MHSCSVRVASRDQQVVRVRCKNATKMPETTELVAGGGARLRLVWADGDSSKSNARSFVLCQVRAVVVTRWDGAPLEEERQLVLLTTNPSVDPFDDRSMIENTCAREAKRAGGWSIIPSAAKPG